MFVSLFFFVVFCCFFAWFDGGRLADDGRNEILVKTIEVAGGRGGDDSLGGGGGGGGGGLVEAQKEVAREVKRVIGSAVWQGGGDEGEGGSADRGAVAGGSAGEALI